MKKSILAVSSLLIFTLAIGQISFAAGDAKDPQPATAAKTPAAAKGTPPAPAVTSPAAAAKAAAEAKAQAPEAAMGAFDDMKMGADEAKKIIVARVNGKEITMFQLVRMMNQLAPRYVKSPEDVTDEITARVKKDALDRLVFDELAVQYAEKTGLKIPAEEIDKVVGQVKESVGSAEEYKKYLETRDLTEEKLKELIVRGRQREKIFALEVYDKTKVADEKITGLYDKMKAAGQLRTEDEVVVKDLLMLKGKEDAETKKKAEQLLDQIKKNDGDMGKLVLDGSFITRRMTVSKEKNPVMYEAIKKMEVEQLSGVVKDSDSYHIFKVIKKDYARDLNQEESRAFVENKLRTEAQNERRVAWEKEMRQNAKIEVLLEKVEKELKEKAEKKEKK